MFIQIQTCTHLQARPDFSIFRFTKGVAGSVILELCFIGRRPGIYDCCVAHCQLFNHPVPALLGEDVEDLMRTIIQVIELYTEKYPDRTVRLRQNSRLQSALFGIIGDIYQDLLRLLFSVDEEPKGRFSIFHRKRHSSSLLLKRKPDSPLKPCPVQMTMNTHSRLFGNPLHVRLCEEMLPISSG